MDSFKKSKFLEDVLAAAKTVGQKPALRLNAERFLVALFEKIDADEVVEDMRELSTARSAAEKCFKDYREAKKVLLNHINSENGDTTLSHLYFRRRMQEANQLVTDTGSDTIDATALLLCIVNTPNGAIEPHVVTDPLGKKESEEKPEEVPIPDLLEDVEIEFFTEEDGDDLFEEDIALYRKESKEAVSKLVNDVKDIRQFLQQSVFGQDNAINVFATGYFQAMLLAMTDRERRRPRATFLFAGPPGVGKTFLAEKIAEALKLPFMRFDMSGYADKESNIEFCGSDKVYKNGKAGNVTSFVAENPKCVLLFDEIEKAHMCVIHLFLQMLDAGRLHDNYTDKEVSFADAIVILTTNAGKQLYEESESGDLSTVSRKVIIKALEKDKNPSTGSPYFPGAICSRFASGNVVMFNHIGANNLRSIARKEILRHAGAFERKTYISIEIDENVYTALLLSEGSAADARTIRSRAETFFNDEIYELLRLISSEKVASNVEDIESIRISLDLTGANADVAALFTSQEKRKILVLASKETVALCQTKTPEMDMIGVQTAEDAIKAVKTQDIDFALLDMRFDAQEHNCTSLNAEDAESPARDFHKFLKEQNSGLPVYLLEVGGSQLSDEERVSFMRQGVRDVLEIGGELDIFNLEVADIADALHQQASMIKLAKENKLISFETAQSISEDGKSAQIRLFDLSMAVAVESEDAKNIVSEVSKPNVRFEDVIGAEDAKKELTYFVEYLKNPKKYMGTGVKPPKGMIFYGPPGTGKTMLAKAMACEAGVTFLAAEGNQFLKSLVGAGGEKVHEIFRTARKYAPSILFIDEIDAIAKERTGGVNASSNGEATLTAFLAEMDGFATDPSKPVLVLAATNFDVEPGGDKSLDPALMRRFDRRIFIDLPNKEDRIRFLKMKIAKNPALAISDRQIGNTAIRSTGMSLAELDSVVELALRSAIRSGNMQVTDDIFEEAFETFNSGDVKKWDASTLERVARHESGHALLHWLAGNTPSYLTVVARGNHGGYMQSGENEDKKLFTREELLARIRCSLGGRAAEIVYYGPKDGISTGASGDLASATNTAYHIVCTYGMDEEFGLAVLNGRLGGDSTEQLRAAINRILKEQMEEAIRLISANKDKIDALVEALQTRNHMNGAEIEQLLGKPSAAR